MTVRATRISRRWYDTVLDLLALAGILAIVMFPVAALTSVSDEPKVADAAVVELAPLDPHAERGQPLRDLPAFSAGGATAQAVASGQISDRAALDALIADQTRAVFGPQGDDQLLGIAAGCIDPGCTFTDVERRSVAGMTVYPLQFAAIDRILDAALGTDGVSPARSAAINDLAGLLVLAQQDFPSDYQNAHLVAYALYDRTRGEGACDPQLNLAMLTSTLEGSGAYEKAVSEYQRADQNCAHEDPTPLWALGQYQSVRGPRTAALATFRELTRRFPGSVLGWSGEADTLVRDAYRRNAAAPFAARADFRRAAALYRRSRAIGAARHDGRVRPEDRDPGLLAGEARARSGLQDFDAAATLDRAALRASGADSATLSGRLADDLERAARAATEPKERTRRFAEAAEAARATGTETDVALDAKNAPPRLGPGLFETNYFSDNALVSESAAGPISIGANRLRTVEFSVGTIGTAPLGFTGAALDISFIPQFRDDPGGALAASCRHQRDLVLANPASNALTDTTGSCGNLQAIADYERLGHLNPDTDGSARSRILDADQNLWRFAGDLDRARHTAEAWAKLDRKNPLAADRAGEIAYLQGDYPAAVGFFRDASRRRPEPDPNDACATPTAEEVVANEKLKLGTALEMDGKLAAASAALEEADTIAGPLVAAAADATNFCGGPQAAFDSYNARLQLGDTALRSHTKEMSEAESKETFEEAERHYAAARERQALLTAQFRPEVLENNEAIVLVQLGKHRAALEAIDAAVKVDPMNPVFLENKGYVEERSDDRAAAVRTYRTALEADPTAYQAANNLGVLLAEDGHLSEAAAAFRSALAAKRDNAAPDFKPADNGRAYRSATALHQEAPASTDYPIGAFNLGLVLNRMGPGHLLESQGELAAATRADPELRENDHELISDDETIFTNLDLSKPVPPQWHLASAEQHAPVTAAGAVLALLLFIALKTVVQEKIKEKATEEALEAEHRHPTRIRRINERIPGAVAVVAVVGVFAYPLARSSGATRNDYLLIGIGVAITTLAFMRLRSAMARREGIATRHYTHVPAVLVGGATALVGMGFAPMPATKDHESLPGYARWTATGLLAFLTLTLLVTGRFTGVPLATHLGEAGLVMTASTLIPIKPYDGAYLEKGHLGFLVALALTGVAVLVELRVL